MKNILPILFLALLFACGTDINSSQQTMAVDAQSFAKVVKYSEGDPFIETIKESEFFKLSGLEDKVIETTNGTIISIPKGVFRDSKGNIVEKEVTVEITDIASFEEQFNSNINSPEGQQVLLNGGALFINATSDGAQLVMNSESPIYVEVNQKPDPDLLMFEGIRNDKGEMQWINPKQPKQFLIPVDLDELDFLPSGFANEVEIKMPFGNHKTTSKKLNDSLYYSLNKTNPARMQYRQHGGHASEDTYVTYDTSYTTTYDNLGNQNGQKMNVTTINNCPAIKPAAIKVLKGKKFAKTFIATKQFEERLQTIFQTKKQAVLEIYTNNLSKDLSHCDSLAANQFKVGSPFEKQFRKYAKENYGNVQHLPRSVKKLGEYYAKNLKKVEAELKAAKEKYEKALLKKSAEAKKIKAEYEEILTKRQHYRLKKHDIVLSKFGWIAPGKILKPFTINLTVANGADYDRVHVYTIDPTIQSIFAWKSKDKVHFQYAYPQDLILVYKNGIQAKALVVAYKEDKPFTDIQNFKVEEHIEIDFKLQSSTKKDLNKLLRKLDKGHLHFNKLKVDLKYQAHFYKEQKRLDKLMEERIAMAQLSRFVYNCEGGSVRFN